MSDEGLACPVCAAELTVEQLFTHADARAAFLQLASLTLPLGSKVLAYVALFAPAKNRMTLSRKVKVIEQILPDLMRGAIERKGREWTVTHDDWREAIDQMLTARDLRKIGLPLTGHGYLYEILCGLADKAEGQAERARERERKGQQQPRAGGAVASAIAAVLPSVAPASSTEPAPAPPSQLAREMVAKFRRRPASTDDQEEATK